jgi:hypothetical protein
VLSAYANIKLVPHPPREACFSQAKRQQVAFKDDDVNAAHFPFTKSSPFSLDGRLRCDSTLLELRNCLA